jgi:site-specific DNA recombinase
MGRLTLNVLLSFAQFEREVIGERVRDKIAASKAKGIWVGGSVPLGYASVNKKLVVVPEEAETVRLIFQRYLELGSIRTLLEDLHRQGIRTRRQTLATGKIRGGISFGVGPLAHLLRNRFYIGEVVYHGAVCPGEQEPVIDRALFDAVQAKLAASATTRQLKLRASPAILTGRLFDDRGNRMTPSHTNKLGARYRYYVSHAVLPKRNNEAGGVTRVNAPDIEAVVVTALRNHLGKSTNDVHQDPATDRGLIEQNVERIVIKSQALEIQLINKIPNDSSDIVIATQWTMATTAAVSGVLHSPSHGAVTSAGNRDALLTAIAKARAWINDFVEGRVTSFGQIAKHEGKVERHIRLLAPLAFVSPKIIAAIVDGSMSSVGVTELARRVSHQWAER